MTKVKLKDITKDLIQQASVMVEEAGRVKRNADVMVQSLRKQEAQFQREEEELRNRQRLEQQMLMAQQHTKAWTMPDEDEAHAEPEAKAEPAKPPVEAAAEKAPEKPAAPAKEEPAVVSAPEKAPEKPIVQEAPAPAAQEPVKPAIAQEKPETPAAAQAEAEAPTPAPAQEAPKPAAPAQPRPAAQGQQFGRPAPGAQQGPYGRPAPGAQGQFGRPAPGAQQGPYGRPAPGAQQGPYGRPAPGAQGQYGRPAPGAQGQYGRPAPGAQGQYGRPAPGAQGQYGRPAPGAQGQYGRPAPGAQGQFGRPAPGAQGQFGRPAPGGQGQFGRPAPGGAPRSGGAPRPGQGRSRGPELTPTMEKERVSNYDPNKKNYVRQHDPERVVKTKKQMVKENFTGYDDDVVRGGRRARAKKPSAQQLMAPIRIEKAIMTAENITVKDLTERIGKPAGEIIKKLFLLGIMATINSELEYESAALVASEFGVDLELKLDKTAEDYLSDADFEDTESDLITRPPVITIMGHVDHGKTSLLDYIRKAHVTQSEAGGITQHIGAYTVELDGRQITFLDTPGHEAFTAMRMRGAQATDIAVLVVAADDGVMPQTVEAINHAKAAKVPIIIAINKMDKPGADPERVKQDMTKYELVPEEWGGDTIMVPVSAVTGEGVSDLLEMILLQADVLQLRANPDRLARGVIIEAKLDKTRGPLATVLVQNGTLRVGDNIVAGMASGRVRSMLNDRGERVQEAGPSMPVEVAGFNEVPNAGEDMMAVEDDKLSRQVAQERRDKLKASRSATSAKVSLDNLFAGITEGKVVNLNIIIKADVQGSVEAVKQALEKLSNDEVKVRVLHAAVGAITKDDVNLASAFNAIIIGFNIRPDSGARDAAEREEIDVRLYRVIYQATEDIEKAMKGLLAPEFREVLLGHAQVRNVFKITGAGTIAGCMVQDGKMQRNASVRLLRDNVVVFEGKLSSLRRFKDDVREVASGYECGMSLENYNDIKENDVVECYLNEEIQR